jgi:hypothetical protein
MDLWFGDSWPIGSELGAITDTFDKNIFPNVEIGRDNPLKAFPHYISTYRNQSYINFSRGASSIDYALHQLIKFCTTAYSTSEQYTAFLCATAQNRGFGISSALSKDIHYGNNENKTQHDLFIYDSIISLNCFYSVCTIHNITCYIIPIFCDLILPPNLQNLVLFKDSILTNSSLVEETFNTKFIEDSYTHIEDKYHGSGICAQYDWIRPNLIHPNVQGHKKLAYKLIELLENH